MVTGAMASAIFVVAWLLDVEQKPRRKGGVVASGGFAGMSEKEKETFWNKKLVFFFGIYIYIYIIDDYI